MPIFRTIPCSLIACNRGSIRPAITILNHCAQVVLDSSVLEWRAQNDLLNTSVHLPSKNSPMLTIANDDTVVPDI